MYQRFETGDEDLLNTMVDNSVPSDKILVGFD